MEKEYCVRIICPELSKKDFKRQKRKRYTLRSLVILAAILWDIAISFLPLPYFLKCIMCFGVGMFGYGVWPE